MAGFTFLGNTTHSHSIQCLRFYILQIPERIVQNSVPGFERMSLASLDIRLPWLPFRRYSARLTTLDLVLCKHFVQEPGYCHNASVGRKKMKIFSQVRASNRAMLRNVVKADTITCNNTKTSQNWSGCKWSPEDGHGRENSHDWTKMTSYTDRLEEKQHMCVAIRNKRNCSPAPSSIHTI